ncbi:hypothetical protein PV328_011855 [Microctonus aethiopoides]|uniref:Uncharacterized protein n=1 Tax=Microctonus aethiopoides TaxID=144406 RepID=A0AA39KQ42_9HYME|nr:hypothetical protein PV328_011855 [Microctonus aethiopoides]
MYPVDFLNSGNLLQFRLSISTSAMLDNSRIIAFAAVLAIAFAAPAQNQQQDIVIVKEVQHENIGVDGYKYNYELSNGQSVQESAELKRVAGIDEPVLVVSGSFSYVDPETKQRYTVTYTADENGFHPSGAHISA